MDVYFHGILFLANLLLFLVFLCYVLIAEHRTEVDDEKYKTRFKDLGLTESQIDKISHDDDLWYFQGESTCVGYSASPSTRCPKNFCICSGETYETYGTFEQQSKDVAEFIQGKLKKTCPLVY